jgi:hypothetical protein
MAGRREDAVSAVCRVREETRSAGDGRIASSVERTPDQSIRDDLIASGAAAPSCEPQNLFSAPSRTSPELDDAASPCWHGICSGAVPDSDGGAPHVRCSSGEA